MEENSSQCWDADCVCRGSGSLVWVVDLHRWRYQLLCNRGGLIYLEVEDDIEVYDYVGETPGLKGNPVRDTPPLPGPEDYLRCVKCNRLVVRSGKHQKYCEFCAREAALARKREWIRRKRSSEKSDRQPLPGEESSTPKTGG